MGRTIAKIAVAAAIPSIDKPYDYAVPDALAEKCVPGVRCTVPFGRGNKRSEGVVLALEEEGERRELKCVFLLIDIRHDPSANDRQMYDWIVSNGYAPVIIATKSDKLNRSQIPKHVKMVREGLGMNKEGIVIPFSAVSKQGREEIWQIIEEMSGNGEENSD